MKIKDLFRIRTLSRGEVGVEIEMEGRRLVPERSVSGWTPEHDGSLRGESIEWVFNRPRKREEVGGALDILFKALSVNKATINESARTSVHVHVNFQESSLAHVLNTCLIYYTVEEILMKVCGVHRSGNFYCMSRKDAETPASILQAVSEGVDFRTFELDMVRYSALNLGALQKYGSLEFRAMEGTDNPERIKEWVEILLSIKDLAASFSNPLELVEHWEEVGVTGFISEKLPLIASKAEAGWTSVAEQAAEDVSIIGRLYSCPPETPSRSRSEGIQIGEGMSRGDIVDSISIPRPRSSMWIDVPNPLSS